MSLFDSNWYGAKPPCFNSDKEWYEWNKLNDVVRSRPESYCADCTPQYASKMRAVGRCLYPEVKFYRINGGLTGCRRNPDPKYDEESESEPSELSEAD